MACVDLRCDVECIEFWNLNMKCMSFGIYYDEWHGRMSYALRWKKNHDLGSRNAMQQTLSHDDMSLKLCTAHESGSAGPHPHPLFFFYFEKNMDWLFLSKRKMINATSYHLLYVSSDTLSECMFIMIQLLGNFRRWH